MCQYIPKYQALKRAWKLENYCMARFIILCNDMFLWGLRLVLNQSVSVYWVSVRWYILSLKKDWKIWNYRKKKTANTGHLPSWTGCNSSAGPVPDGIGLTYQYAAGLINTASIVLYLGVGVLQTLLLVQTHAGLYALYQAWIVQFIHKILDRLYHLYQIITGGIAILNYC